MVRARKTLNSNNLIEDAPISGEVDVETRHRILQAAAQLFSAKGYKGVSMREVAEVVEVTPAALYYHFSGKDELFIGVMGWMLDAWAAGVYEVTEKVDDIRQKLINLTRFYLTRRDSGMHMLMRDSRQYLPEDKQPQVWQHYRNTYHKAVNKVFQDGIDSGQLSQTIPATTLSTMYTGMLNSFVFNPSQRQGLTDPIEVERIATTVTSILLDGAAQR